MPGSPRLDLASSIINLNKSLIDFVPSSNSLVNISRDTYDWLVRERIDESAFQRCKEMATGLAFPNTKGEVIRHQIQDRDRRLLEGKTKAPMKLVVSGSLGRLLAKHEDTCYMVSTVAILTKYHDLKFTSDVLCSMILDQGGHEEHVTTKYHIQRSPIKAVISKIVDSIYLNVINAGHNLDGLPKELEHLHHHFIDHNTFAGIIMGIQRTENDIVIRTTRFLPTLCLWLLNHFEGKFEVSVQNRVLFEDTLGGESRTIRFMVTVLCPPEINSDRSCLKSSEVGTVQAFISVGDDLFTFLQGSHSFNQAAQIFSRVPLYDVEFMTAPVAKVKFLNNNECCLIASVAKSMMRYILKIPVAPRPMMSPTSFQALLNSKTESHLTVADLLPRYPGLLHLNTGLSEGTEFVVRRPDDDDICITRTPRSIIKWLPAVQSLLGDIAPRCPCDKCASGADLEECQKGCLREVAVKRLFTLLVHGFCDAVGVQDVSGLSKTYDQMDALSHVLYRLFQERMIDWDSWFELVACTATGIPIDEFWSFERDPGSGLSSWAAAQHGSFVLMSHKIDLSKEVRLRGCFSVMTSIGNLQGVPDGIALVRCEEGTAVDHPVKDLNSDGSMSILYLDDTPWPEIENAPVKEALYTDSIQTEVYTAIFSEGGSRYRFLTTLRAGRTIRVIDPTQWVTKLAVSHHTKCSHEPDAVSSEYFDRLKVRGFDNLLAGDPYDYVYEGTVVSKTLDSHLKLNVLLCIGYRGCAIRNASKCCIECAIDAQRKRRTADDFHSDARSSWLLNVDIPDSSGREIKLASRGIN